MTAVAAGLKNTAACAADDAHVIPAITTTTGIAATTINFFITQ